MKRVLLRLLLIVSFVMNGVAAPWAVAAPVDAPAAAMEDCHHAENIADEAADEHACCDGPGCQCGCLLTPMLAWRLAAMPKLAWAEAPRTVPATRPVARLLAAPFRPPAA